MSLDEYKSGWVIINTDEQKTLSEVLDSHMAKDLIIPKNATVSINIDLEPERDFVAETQLSFNLRSEK